MGEQISRDFAGQKVLLIGVLKGATIFLADLARCISLDATFDFLSTSSYGKGHQQSGEVRLLKDVDHSMEGQNIILVEDILDTGLTLSYLRRVLSAHQPRSLKIAALLDKPARRIQKIEGDYIDLTLLKPESTSAEVEQLCRESVEYGFTCVMLHPTHIALAASLLAQTRVNIGCVVGFPFGANTTAVKRFEALDAIRLGAREID